jgi:hypothetical protein
VAALWTPCSTAFVNEFDFQKPKKAIVLIWVAEGEAAAGALGEAAAGALGKAAAEGADDGLVEAVLEHAANAMASNVIATSDSLLILTDMSLSRLSACLRPVWCAVHRVEHGPDFTWSGGIPGVRHEREEVVGTDTSLRVVDPALIGRRVIPDPNYVSATFMTRICGEIQGSATLDLDRPFEDPVTYEYRRQRFERARHQLEGQAADDHLSTAAARSSAVAASLTRKVTVSTTTP